MAQGVGSSKPVRFAPDTFGGKFFGAVDYSGPASYVQGGDAIDPHIFGFPNTIIALYASGDQTGTYQGVPVPLQDDVTPWRLQWVGLDSTAGQAPAGTNLSGFTIRLSAIGV